MTRTERTIVQHWRSIGLACLFVALFGIAWATWHRIDASDRNYAAATTEANKRGDAVSTLTGDVRALRVQIKGLGKTPVAPDPSNAVPSLPDRTTVPVPIPGPSGAAGAPGKSGSPGATGSPGVSGSPGTTGSPGVQGPTGPTGPAGPAGPAGADGKDGAAGKDGTDGKDGQSCPTGYSWQTPADDPDALVCRKDGAPSPTPTSTGLAVGLPPDRRRII
jgi:hypothetical protein